MNPEVAELYNQAGVALEKRDFEGALQRFEALTKRDDAPPEAWLNAAQLCLLSNQAKRAEQFLEAVRPSLQTKRDDGTALDHPVVAGLVARCYRLQRRFDAVIELVTPWVGQAEYTADMQLDHGLALAGKKHLTAALVCLEDAARRSPQDVEILSHAASVSLELNEPARAHQFADQALAINPNLHQALCLKADAYDAQGAPEQAFRFYQQAKAYGPWPDAALSTISMLSRSLIEWPMVDELDGLLMAHLEAAEAGQVQPHTNPFAYVYASDDQSIARRAAEQMVRPTLARFEARREQGLVLPALPKPGLDQANRRLRLGYLSSDFNHHAGMHLVASMFQHHDREQFEVYGLAVGDHSRNTMRETIERQMDRMVDIADPDPLTGATAIRELDVDILIDLRGFTANSRIHLCLERPAHLHATWLGYAGPMPAGIVDYQIVDPIIAPPADRDDFGASLAYLPTTYQMTDNQFPQGEPITRDVALPGVPADAFVFASFCQTYKIQKETFDCWLAILVAVPDAILWLWADHDQAQQNLRAYANQAGIDPDRLVFAGRLPKSQHLSRVAHADLILDTWRYGGHVTTTDMLCAGVPVLAKRGTHFASRVAESLLAAAGLPDMVADDAEAYRDRAIALAQDPAALRAIRTRVATIKTDGALLDTPGRVRHLEGLYRAMWRRYCAGEAPGDIRLAPDAV